MVRKYIRLMPIMLLVLLALLSVSQGFVNGLRFVDSHWESAALFLSGENPYQWFFDGRYFQGVYVDATQAPSTIAFILPFGMFSHYVGNMLWGGGEYFLPASYGMVRAPTMVCKRQDNGCCRCRAICDRNAI